MGPPPTAEQLADMATALHDANNDLSILIAELDLMAGRADLPEALRPDLEQAVAACLRVIGHVRRLQDGVRALR